MTFTDTTRLGYLLDNMFKDNKMTIPIHNLGCDHIGCDNWPLYWIANTTVNGLHVKDISLCDEHYQIFKKTSKSLSKSQKQYLLQRRRKLFSTEEALLKDG
jgi:hypothetical protein